MEDNKEYFEIEYDLRTVQPDFKHEGNRVMDVFNFFYDDFLEYLKNTDDKEHIEKLFMKQLREHGRFLEHIIPDFACKVLPQLILDAGMVAVIFGMEIMHKKKENIPISQISAVVEYPPNSQASKPPMAFVFRMHA